MTSKQEETKRTLIIKVFDARTMNDARQDDMDADCKDLKLDYAVYDRVSDSKSKRIGHDNAMIYAVSRKSGNYSSTRLPHQFLVPNKSVSGGYKSTGYVFTSYDTADNQTEIEVTTDDKTGNRHILYLGITAVNNREVRTSQRYMIDANKIINNQEGYDDPKYTVLFEPQKDNNVSATPIQSEQRYVLFVEVSKELPELDNYVGIITGDSRYVAPMMYKTNHSIIVKTVSIPIYINVGPIYGKVNINTIEGHPLIRYTRSYISGKLVGSVFRTAFIPFRETQDKDEEPTEADGTPGFNRYCDAGSGEIIAFEAYKHYNNQVKTLLAQYFPTVLCNLMGYLID